MKFFPHIYILTLVLVTACSDEPSVSSEKEKFVRIFDDNQFNASYKPIDIRQTADGGYLILANRDLAETSFDGIYLLRTDETGAFLKDVDVSDGLVNAIPGLTEINGKYYFFCMSSDSYLTQLMEVDENLESITNKAINLNYPSAATYVDNEFLLLSFNQADKETIISRIDENGNTFSYPAFSAGVGNDIVDEQIISHFQRTGKQFPFQIGKVNTGLYYFNGFFEYNFSLVFTNLGVNGPTGSITGEQNSVVFNNIAPITPDLFAVSIANNGINYINPATPLTKTGTTTITNYSGYNLPELEPTGQVKILRIVSKEKNALIYGVDTKAKQIGLLFYDESKGALMSSRYFGFSNPYEIGNLIPTADGGLIICGTTYIAGRFARICLFKLSKSEVEENIK